ncbi:YibE/F family protein [bacterium]|nr:YibE/F family protein [bacterium]
MRRARAGACGELERDGGAVGGRYVVAVERSGGEWVAGRVVRERDRYLLGLTAALVALLAITTGWRGLATVGSVAWAWGLLVGLVLPAVLAGARAGMLCVAVAPAIAAPTLLAIGGVNRKTASAIAGTLCGLLAGGLVAAGFVDAMALTGLEVEFGPHAHLDNALWFARPLHHVRFASLLMAGLLLAGLGAVMDVSMAVASTVAQVHRAAPTASRGALFRSGLAAGRDIFGVMVFTLVVVFAGSQLASLVPLAPTAWADRWLTLTNYEEIACELARAAAVAAGMALCVPAAAAVAALLHGKRSKAEAERVPPVSIRPRFLLRPLLAVLACLAVAGLADELTLRSHCGGPGRTAHETTGRVVAFGRPAVEPSARSNDPHDRTFFRSQPVVVQPYFGPHAGHLLAARLLLGPNPSHHLRLRPDSAVHLSVDDDAGATDVKLYKPPLRYRWGLVAMLVTAVMLVAAGGRAGV